MILGKKIIASLTLFGWASLWTASPVHAETQLRFKKDDPRSLTHPQKKNRFCYCMFGYKVKYFNWAPFFKVGQILSRDKIGQHHYGSKSIREKEGQIYTCKAGFIDFSHMRAGIDWAVYIALNIARGNEDIALEDEDRTVMTWRFNLDKIQTPEDLARIAERIAIERLTWHEIASWHYHPPLKTFSEQISVFSPEDMSSNAIGARIGAKVALRMLAADSSGAAVEDNYSAIVDDEIQKMMVEYQAVATKQDTKIAFDQVDRAKGAENPWWDSSIAMSYNTYLFKRNSQYLPFVQPWLVPNAERAGCTNARPEVLYTPSQLSSGEDIFQAYSYQIFPKAKLFGTKRRPEIFPKFSAFDIQDLPKIVKKVDKQLEKILGAGMDQI